MGFNSAFEGLNLPMFRHHTVQSHKKHRGKAHSLNTVSMDRNCSVLSLATKFLLCISLITEPDGSKSPTKESGYQALKGTV